MRMEDDTEKAIWPDRNIMGIAIYQPSEDYEVRTRIYKFDKFVTFSHFRLLRTSGNLA